MSDFNPTSVTSFRSSRKSIVSFLLGNDLGIYITLLSIAAIWGLVLISFFLHFGKPVPGANPNLFPATHSYQSVDFPVWFDTSLMLPRPLIPVRSPRPLFPAPVKLAQFLGITDYFTLTRKAQTVPEPFYGQTMKVLITANWLWMFLALWMFFSACRYFGMEANDSFLATILAGSGYGFTFWVAQLIPEVMSYFSVMLVLVLVIWAEEGGRLQLPKARFYKWCVTGVAIGILMLEKEFYFLIMFAVLYLIWRRQWKTACIFTILSVIPAAVWMYYIIKILKVFDPVAYSHQYGYLVWLKDTLLTVPLWEMLTRLGGNLCRQIVGVFEAFVFVPIIFTLIGLYNNPIKRIWIPLGLFFVSFSAMFFASNFIMPRICFMAWPIVYFYAWIGIGFAASKMNQFHLMKHGVLIWKIVILVLIATIQNINIYKLYNYG